MLDISGYIVRTKVVKKIKDGAGGYHWKNNLDVELALEMYVMRGNFDTAVLMSGDSDFADLLDRLKKARKRVMVLSTRGHVSKELLNRAKYIDLRKLKSDLAQ